MLRKPEWRNGILKLILLNPYMSRAIFKLFNKQYEAGLLGSLCESFSSWVGGGGGPGTEQNPEQPVN
jgi:hypothetical protein